MRSGWGRRICALAALRLGFACCKARTRAPLILASLSLFLEQAAAGILSHLLSLIPTLASTFAAAPRTADSDLSAATLRALRDVMLAQAQECAWAKAVVDRMKDGTIAKLAARVEALYASALEHAAAKGADAGACELPKEWQSHLGAKRWHFAAAAQFRKSVEDLGANRYGAELARLQLAQAHIKKALELAKARNVSPALAADAKSLQDVINSSLSRATRDNDLIYLDPIPAVAQLAPLVGVSMAEPRLAPDIKDPSALARQLGPLFEQLTPYSVHLAMSIYEDRKEAMLRELEETKSELEADASS
jgi:programmed cell death 6-interacting protein